MEQEQLESVIKEAYRLLQEGEVKDMQSLIAETYHEINEKEEAFKKEIWNQAYAIKVRILDNDSDIMSKDDVKEAISRATNHIAVNNIDEYYEYGGIVKGIEKPLEASLEEQLLEEFGVMEISDIYDALGNIKEEDGEYTLPCSEY